MIEILRDIKSRMKDIHCLTVDFCATVRQSVSTIRICYFYFFLPQRKSFF
eukprot:SAG11_NODE_88_length_17244_cov_17.187460_13_plen_50_part_00